MSNRVSYLLSVVKAGLRKGETADAVKEQLVQDVQANVPAGDVDAAIKRIDEFGSKQSFLMNIGDEKGVLLDDVITRAQPKIVVELGAFCGYSGLRIGRLLPPGGRLLSIELNAKNADVSTRIWQHAGLGDRVTAVNGSLDDGTTLKRLQTEFGLGPGSIDVLFIDHEHSVYLSDLQLLLGAGLLHTGTVVLADNVKVPGAPKYLAYMRAQEGKDWRTIEHKAHLEYQPLIPDLVLESTYLGPSA
jgi:catechol O-methyltransferase